MVKGPLVTRSEIRKRKQQEEDALERNRHIVQKQSEKEYKKEEKNIDNFYRKELKKNKPITKTRTSERQRSREMNSFLVKGIIIVTLLLIVVGLMVWFL